MLRRTFLVRIGLPSLLLTSCMPARSADDAQGTADPGPPPGPLGAKYVGKVIVSTKPIAFDSADDGSVVTKATLGRDPLYARYWTRTSPTNAAPGCFRKDRGFGAAAGEISTDATVNGATVTLSGNPVEAGLERKIYAAALTGDAQTALTTPYKDNDKLAAQRVFQTQLVPTLHEGTNRVELRTYWACRGVDDSPAMTLATGALDLEVPPGGIDAFLASVPDLAPSRHPENRRIVEAATEELTADWKDATVLGGRVQSNSWEPRRNELGVLVSKMVFVDLVWRKNGETNPALCHLTTVSASQDAAGGSLFVTPGRADSVTYPCAKAPSAKGSADPKRRAEKPADAEQGPFAPIPPGIPCDATVASLREHFTGAEPELLRIPGRGIAAAPASDVGVNVPDGYVFKVSRDRWVSVDGRISTSGTTKTLGRDLTSFVKKSATPTAKPVALLVPPESVTDTASFVAALESLAKAGVPTFVVARKKNFPVLKWTPPKVDEPTRAAELARELEAQAATCDPLKSVYGRALVPGAGWGPDPRMTLAAKEIPDAVASCQCQVDAPKLYVTWSTMAFMGTPVVGKRIVVGKGVKTRLLKTAGLSGSALYDAFPGGDEPVRLR